MTTPAEWEWDMVDAGARVLLKKALRQVGAYFAPGEPTDALAYTAKRTNAPVEQEADRWIEASMGAGLVATDTGRGRSITTEEKTLMKKQAERCLELFRACGR